MTGDDLIMELTLEQGGGRETQVQPPWDVWHFYFHLNVPNLPTYKLKDVGARTAIETRPVVEHDHNWTIEIDGAVLPRPATLHMRRIRAFRYDYRIFRPGDPEFDHCDWILSTFENPEQKRGRRWLIL